jgi:hypothetical protein
MNPNTAREVLIAEAIGDLARLLQQADALALTMERAHQAVSKANADLRDHLAAFEGRVNTISEAAKTKVVRYMAANADHATRLAIDLQSRAMADAAKVAFGTEFDNTMQRMQSALRLLFDLRTRQKDRWAELGIAFATGSISTVGLMTFMLSR